MDTFQHYPKCEPSGQDVALVEDRRYNSRDKLLKDVFIGTLDCVQPSEVGTLIDLSRDGLYFTSASSTYFTVGMPLRLILPDARSECLCEVVRCEPLPQGRIGVGARILSW